jgi:multiple sugar transport system ATP-binding protein
VTWAEPKDRGIAMVFQSYALYPRMDVYGNMAFGLRMQGIPKAEVEARVQRAAAILQIGDLLRRKPFELSGGQRQRVAIGRAIVRNVDVFLFDEPLSNLDAKLRSELRVEIKRLHQNLGNTMVYVTHDQIEALTLADRIVVLKDGVVQQIDTPSVVYGKPANRFVAGFIGSPAMNFLEGEIGCFDGIVSLHVGPTIIPLASYAFTRVVEAGQKVTLGVRPEHVLTGMAAAGCACRLDTKIELREPMGADTLFWTRIGTMPLSVRVASEIAERLDTAMQIGISPDRISLFDAASGERI